MILVRGLGIGVQSLQFFYSHNTYKWGSDRELLPQGLFIHPNNPSSWNFVIKLSLQNPLVNSWKHSPPLLIVTIFLCFPKILELPCCLLLFLPHPALQWQWGSPRAFRNIASPEMRKTIGCQLAIVKSSQNFISLWQDRNQCVCISLWLEFVMFARCNSLLSS